MSDDARLNEILDRLEDLGYPQADFDAVGDYLTEGVASAGLKSLISRTVEEIGLFAKGVKETIPTENDAKFTAQLADSLLSLSFPYSFLRKQGPGCFNDVDNRTYILDFLLSELQACRMMAALKVKQESKQEVKSKGFKGPAMEFKTESMDMLDDQTEAANKRSSAVRAVCHAAGVTIPVNCTQGEVALTPVLSKVQAYVNSNPVADQPLLSTAQYTDKQLSVLENINKSFSADYSVRRQVLLKRLVVTTQSFLWSDRGKAKEDEIKALVARRIASIPKTHKADMYEVFAATKELINIAAVTDSDATKHTATSVKRIIIGKVPDRGGRTDESSRSDGSMPTFKARQASGGERRGGGRGGGRGGRGGGRGGKVKGAWNDDNKDSDSSSSNSNSTPGNNESSSSNSGSGSSGKGNKGGRGGNWSGGHKNRGGYGGRGGGKNKS